MNDQPSVEWPTDLAARTGAILDAFESIYIPTPSHQAIHLECDILRHANRNRKGKAMGALRLAQLSSASKTACFENYCEKAIAEHARLTGNTNPYLILYISLLSCTSPKTICQEICRLLGDENWEIGTTSDLINRMRGFVARAGVELIIIDEVQELKGKRNDRKDVTNLLKSLLNKGIAPLVLVGDETSEDMFEDNIHLVNRAGSELKLEPFSLHDTSRLGEFKGFCLDLEAEMLRQNLVRHEGVLSKGKQQKLLLKWSGGHIGRVCRIIAQALQHSILRCATAVEEQDLRYAIENFAIPAGYGKDIR